MDWHLESVYSPKTFTQGAQSEIDSDIIEQVLEAIQNGNSCIPATQAQVDTLQNLVICAADASQEIAPFVFDQQHLYLYRYWILEHALAEQVSV